jgi:hypothetical protein
LFRKEKEKTPRAPEKPEDYFEQSGGPIVGMFNFLVFNLP